MPDFKLVKTNNVNTKISKDFSFNFEIESSGLYLITIVARASAWWQNFSQFLKRYLQDDNLSIKLDTISSQLSWNGNNLKGLEQTSIFLTPLNAGQHKIIFKVKQQPKLGSINIYEILNTKNPNLAEIIPSTIEDGNRRPLIKLLISELSVEKIIIEAKVFTGRQHLLFFHDDDDLKLIINEEIISNNLSKSHKDWYWCGRAQSYQKTESRTLVRELSSRKQHILALYTDRAPTIQRFEFILSTILPQLVFNESFIIDDAEFTGLELNQKEIEVFLQDKGNDISTHIAFRKFNEKSSAELIYQAAKVNMINPKVILTKLQAEQGLIFGDKAKNPTQSQLDSAMGVGVLDGGTVLDQYQGFMHQVASGAESLRNLFNQAEKEKFTLKNIDGKTLIVKNNATYSLYRYTPHFAGVKLFFDIYHSFFR
ncbi:hypothetical protein COU88_00930 [Candidatus Roizmanbacteria bacterium CG10_big_fil_rev_8_21_14_0_10_39_6]|uniref:Uncharacterized protein n=1 Tax=Candidatus Roizmanbacteria bacterium CG10_big_fil_rev_8_21_14_0_10_39_6 TaxID=1974853 RepID=A0A2M8KTC3_9BACT|nr:MAG: hypothetical protein COU88_00930 [Candidatus Roizmanbacteria bacterium CG10_big_fil_rev_8_21_14_0_10_39_6]